jgi:hypothetical protein
MTAPETPRLSAPKEENQNKNESYTKNTNSGIIHQYVDSSELLLTRVDDIFQVSGRGVDIERNPNPAQIVHLLYNIGAFGRISGSSDDFVASF